MMLTTFLIAMALQVTYPATCRSLGLEPTRTWRFDKHVATWRVTHWQGDDVANAVSVDLPSTATVLLARDAVRVRARSSNGGIDVTLTGTPTLARLDVYVSYELEVNVDASLTPAIDQLSTESPLGVRCDIVPAK